MKRFLISLVLLAAVSFTASATITKAYKDVNWENFEVVSTAEEVTDDVAVITYCTISYSSPNAVRLLREGYYDVQLEKGYWGVWVMIFSEGQWFSVNYVYNPDNKYVGCYLTNYEYIGD